MKFVNLSIDCDRFAAQNVQSLIVIKEKTGVVELKPSCRSRFGGWVKQHRWVLLFIFFILLSFIGGGVCFVLAKRFSLPFLNPLGPSTGEPLIVLSAPTVLDQLHPISGVFYTKAQKDTWGKRRPLAVMIDNHALARPYHFGLQKADLIWEAVAEGGIPRLLAVFHSQDIAKLGPVRSARVYYIDWALEFPAYYSHVGGAGTPGSPANIFAYIRQKGVLDLDQFRLGTSTYWRGGDIMIGGRTILSHINYTSTKKLWQAGERLYPGTNKLPKFKAWKFKSDIPYTERSEKQKISFNFWYLPVYAVEWRYERTTNTYLRFQGGKKHLDQTTKQQLTAKNVVLLYTPQYRAGDGTAHLLFKTTGSGDAEVFRDGKKIKATWKRNTLSDRTIFYEQGTKKEIVFNRGLTWIEVLPK